MIRKARLTLLIVTIIGGITAAVGFQVNSGNSDNFEQENHLQKLKNYKSSLEETNQFNYKHLSKLEKDLAEDTVENKDSIKNEIKIVEKIIKENNDEIQKITERIERQMQ